MFAFKIDQIVEGNSFTIVACFAENGERVPSGNLLKIREGVGILPSSGINEEIGLTLTEFGYLPELTEEQYQCALNGDNPWDPVNNVPPPVEGRLAAAALDWVVDEEPDFDEEFDDEEFDDEEFEEEEFDPR